MKISTGFYVSALTLLTFAIVTEATFDLQRLLGLQERLDDDSEIIDLLNQSDDLLIEDTPYKRGVGNQKFIACFHPGLQTKCFCDRTKPKYSKNYFYYCRGARRHNLLRPV